MDSAVTSLTLWLTAQKDASTLWVPAIAVPVPAALSTAVVVPQAQMDVVRLEQDWAELWSACGVLCGAVRAPRLRTQGEGRSGETPPALSGLQRPAPACGEHRPPREGHGWGRGRLRPGRAGTPCFMY